MVANTCKQRGCSEVFMVLSKLGQQKEGIKGWISMHTESSKAELLRPGVEHDY